MTEVFKTDVSVPSGILHDAPLEKIELNGNTLRMTFGIVWYAEYDTNENAQKYKGFTACTVELDASKYEDENGCNLYTMLDKHGKFQAVALSLSEFVTLAQREEVSMTYLYIFTCGRQIKTEFSFFASKDKSYRKYVSAELFACTDEIRFIWK